MYNSKASIVLYPLHSIFFSSNIFGQIIASVNFTTTSTSMSVTCSQPLSIEVLQTDMAKKKQNKTQIPSALFILPSNWWATLGWRYAAPWWRLSTNINCAHLCAVSFFHKKFKSYSFIFLTNRLAWGRVAVILFLLQKGSWSVIWTLIQPLLFEHSKRKAWMCLDIAINCSMLKENEIQEMVYLY